MLRVTDDNSVTSLRRKWKDLLSMQCPASHIPGVVVIVVMLQCFSVSTCSHHKGLKQLKVDISVIKQKKQGVRVIDFEGLRQKHIITSHALPFLALAFMLPSTYPEIVFSYKFMCFLFDTAGSEQLHNQQTIWNGWENGVIRGTAYLSKLSSLGEAVRKVRPVFSDSSIVFVCHWHSSDWGHFTVTLYVRILNRNIFQRKRLKQSADIHFTRSSLNIQIGNTIT